MDLKRISLDYMKPDYLMTELRFNIAAARAERMELIHLELAADDDRLRRREYTSVLVRLRQLKREGVIQFFAAEDDFAGSTTEAVYLLNKYPELSALADTSGDGAYRSIVIRV